MNPARRLLLRSVKLYSAPSLARSQVRCLSAGVGQTTASSDGSQGQEPSRSPLAVGVVGLLASGLSVAWYLHSRGREEEGEGNHLITHAPVMIKLLPEVKAAEGEAKSPQKVSVRERRYKDFCSISYNGQPYMTPRDFLESVTLDHPRQIDVQFLNDKDVENLLKMTLSRSKASKRSFRDMWNKGMLTYADYLFLLTALIKTTRQFQIAFRMIDLDANDFVDLKEFSKVQEAVTKQRDNAMIQQSLTRSTLTIHLFGSKGNQRLYSKDFYKFIEDLQTEVLEIEFNKFAGGAPTISEEDFARVLLRHTTWDLDPVFQRLKRKDKPETGIYFSQFSDFCQLLNLLDDFEIAMTMFTIAGTSVTEDEFGRAAKICLGRPLDKSVVSTVFHIFDVDGDGKLSYKEFLSVMKSWKLRGFKIREQKYIGGWQEFRACVKMEMKSR